MSLETSASESEEKDVTKKILQKISILNKCCSFELLYLITES